MHVRTADVVIVGAGLMGLSTARALAERSAGRILVLERDVVGAGATGKSSGVLRCHYGHPVLAHLAWKSLETFRSAGEILGDDVGYRSVGYLVGVGPDNLEALRANIRMLQELGIDTRFVAPEEARGLWPHMDVGDFAGFAYEPLGGYADPVLTAQAYARRAREAGVRIVQGCAVDRILLSPDGSRAVGVESPVLGQVFAPVIVAAAGVWTGVLARTAGINVPVRAQREQLLLIDPGLPLGPVPVYSDLVNLQYGRPEGSGRLLVGNSDHSRPEFVDPDHYRGGVDDHYVQEAVEKFMRRFPSLGRARLVTGYSGAYEVTPDYNPVMGPSPVEGLYLCAGFSGHGFKLTPAVGELMASCILEGHSGDPAVDLSLFRLNRFEEGDLLVSLHPYRGAGQLR